MDLARLPAAVMPCGDTSILIEPGEQSEVVRRKRKSGKYCSQKAGVSRRREDSVPSIRALESRTSHVAELRDFRGLEQARNLDSRHSGNITGKILHLIGKLFVNAARSLVHRGTHQVL
jgi:hypothetical protein